MALEDVATARASVRQLPVRKDVPEPYTEPAEVTGTHSMSIDGASILDRPASHLRFLEEGCTPGRTPLAAPT